MASILQSSFLLTPNTPVNNGVINLRNSNNPRVPTLGILKVSASLDDSNPKTSPPSKEVPAALKLAMEKAKKYKENKGLAGSKPVVESNKDKGLVEKVEKQNTRRDGLLDKGKVSEEKKLTVSNLDFVGLNFADKKNSRALPAGLVQVDDPYSATDMPEVELIIGDSSKFDKPTPSNPEPNVQDGSTDVYKPKVSTWGVFPRPSNISKTFGGGRVIRPGEALESLEDKAAKESRSRQLLAAYKNKTGLTIDPKIKAECEKALKDGDNLMDKGKLKDALPYYEKVMKDLVFKSELHGLAALQWSLCQDSLCRSSEAKAMYEKLQTHPNVRVSKQARQFLFSFQAIDFMKVKRSSPSNTTDYQNYFEVFVEKKKDYSLRVEEDDQEGAFGQLLPYILFLVSPIFVVLCIAAQKGT